MALETVKKEYKRNEMVEIYSSFCRTRNTKSSTQWTLANERLIFFAPSEPVEIPTGCYPEDGRKRAFPVELVPNDAIYGEHYFVAVTTYYLPDGRIRTQNYRTENFEVVP